MQPGTEGVPGEETSSVEIGKVLGKQDELVTTLGPRGALSHS